MQSIAFTFAFLSGEVASSWLAASALREATSARQRASLRQNVGGLSMATGSLHFPDGLIDLIKPDNHFRRNINGGIETLHLQSPCSVFSLQLDQVVRHASLGRAHAPVGMLAFQQKSATSIPSLAKSALYRIFHGPSLLRGCESLHHSSQPPRQELRAAARLALGWPRSSAAACRTPRLLAVCWPLEFRLRRMAYGQAVFERSPQRSSRSVSASILTG